MIGRHHPQRRVTNVGQATVELALALPLICLFLLLIVQVTVVVGDVLAVLSAAREGARAASVSATPHAAATIAATDTTGLAPLAVSTTVAATTVTVTVRYVDRTTVPIVGTLLPDVTIEHAATMALEPP